MARRFLGGSWAAAAMVSGLLVCTAASGCVAPGDEEETTDETGEVAEIADALELENGGLDFEDELPMFGEPELFADLMDVELDIDDAVQYDADVDAMQQAPDGMRYEAAVMWGQFPGDPNVESPRNWSGVIAVNRGAIIVRKTIAFEGPTDNLLPRQDKQVVPFTSATLPHRDGLRVTILDPDPLNAEPLTLSYATPDEGVLYTVALKDLVDGPQGVVVDDAENRIVAVATPTPLDVCQHGMLAGRWHQVAEGRGRFIGPVVDAQGDLLGHLRGIYGVRQNGERVFFGKYINTDGEFRGIFGGHYGSGHFKGRWIHASGERGALGGEYRESIPGPETGGHFMGRWAETTCNLPTGPAGDPSN